jgi:hypothetical protein
VSVLLMSIVKHVRHLSEHYWDAVGRTPHHPKRSVPHGVEIWLSHSPPFASISFRKPPQRRLLHRWRGHAAQLSLDAWQTQNGLTARICKTQIPRVFEKVSTRRTTRQTPLRAG